jgi:hypothetical protein
MLLRNLTHYLELHLQIFKLLSDTGTVNIESVHHALVFVVLQSVRQQIITLVTKRPCTLASGEIELATTNNLSVRHPNQKLITLDPGNPGTHVVGKMPLSKSFVGT